VFEVPRGALAAIGITKGAPALPKRDQVLGIGVKLEAGTFPFKIGCEATIAAGLVGQPRSGVAVDAGLIGCCGH
jgi:hypothetical protein